MIFEVVGFGALNLDKLYKVNKIAREDEESYITAKTESCGGSAANTIIGLSRLGSKTGFIGKVATDPEGSLLHNNLQNENVNTKGIIVTDNGRSGTVSGFVDTKGQRALYVDPGVNDCVDYDEIDIEYINNSIVLHISSFVGKTYENSIKTQEKILDEISSRITVSFDPGRLYTERGVNFLDKFLMRTDILLINNSELKQLNEKADYSNLKPLIETQENTDFIQSEYGIDIVVVKMGSKGSYVSFNGESQFTNAFNVPCVDTTGAGDAFNAGFLHGYVNGDDIGKSAVKGNYVASHCVTQYGATEGLPDLSILQNIE
jgi:ribokinase